MAENLVKIARLGKRTVEVALEEDADVRAALTAAGETLGAREEVRIGGEKVNLNHIVEDGDVVSIVPASGYKGGQ